MGPVTLTDEVGIDIGAHIGEYLNTCFGDRFAGVNPEVLSTLVSAGITGNSSSFAKNLFFEICSQICFASRQGANLAKGSMSMTKR